MMNLKIVVLVCVLVVNVQGGPVVTLVSGKSLVESFRNEGILKDKWILDNDKLIVQWETNLSIQTQVMFLKMSGNPIRIIQRSRYIRYNGGMFSPVSGEEIRLWGLDSVTKSWIADTNEIQLVKLGLIPALDGHVGRRTIYSGTYTKYVQLQSSLFKIDNYLEDRTFIVSFLFVAPVGDGTTNMFPKISVRVKGGERKFFTPSLSAGSQSIERPIRWMSLYKIESKLAP